MKPSVSLDNPQPRSATTWLRRAGIALLALLTIGVALWWSGMALIQWGLQQFLERTSLINPAVSGLSLGLEHGNLENFEFGVDTGSGTLAVQLHGISAAYDLRSPQVETISAAHANLKFAYRPREKPETVTASRNLSFPLPRLTADQLDLEIETPVGPSRFSGRVEVGLTEKHTLEARFQDAQQTMHFELDADMRTAKLYIEQTPGARILDLIASRLDQANQQVTLDANAGPLIEWLSSSEWVPKTLRATSTMPSSRLAAGIDGMRLTLSADTQDRFDSLRGQMKLTRKGDFLAGAELAMAPRHSAVDIDGHLDMAAEETLELIKPWLPEAVSGWQISAGRTQGNLKLLWKPGLGTSGMAELKGRNVNLTAGSVALKDADLALDIRDIRQWSLSMGVVVPTLILGKESEVHNLTAKAKLVENELTLEQAILPVFGGIIEILPDTVDIDQRPINLTLGVQNIDLAQLLNSLHYPALSGTGSISGKLPLRLTADAIELQGGTLQGTRPGVIQYQGPVSDDENLAFKALRNLVYHRLQAEVNYRPNGDYRLGLRLEGGNPEVLSGHPLAFNLNISGQLPELLQKGIRAGDFNQSILEQATSEPAKNRKSTKPPQKPR